MKKKLLSLGMLSIMILILTGCSTAGGFYRSGTRCFVSGNYEEAAINFSSAIAQNPNRADYYIDYGMTLIALGHFDEAVVQFDKAYKEKDIVMVKENNKRALRGKGIAYYNKKLYQEAINLFNKALTLDVLSELDMDILYYKGNSLMTIGAYEEARDTYTAILTTFGNDAAALNYRANTYRSLGDYEKSLEDYDLAISMEPKVYDYYFGKYYLMKDMDNEAGAAEVLEQAAELVTKSKEDQYNQAKVFYYQELYDLALEKLSEGYTNGFMEAHFYIGEIYRNRKDYATAIYYYDKYIQEGELTSPVVYNQIASCLMKQGEYERAIKYLERGISDQNSGMTRVFKKNEIVAYENLGKFDVALAKLTDYLVSYPEDSEARREEEFLKTRQTGFNSLKLGATE